MLKLSLWALLVLVCVTACVPVSRAPAPTPTGTPVVFETILPPDAILALDHPPAVAADEAAAHIGPYDLVMGLSVGGEARAYPMGLLNRHEVANDTLGGQPVAVTFCPLCNTGAAFSRTVTDTTGTTTLTFGVSGKLLDGALVMMDRETGTLWAQSRLQGMEGPLVGKTLRLLTSSQMSWEEWVTAHPTTTLALDEMAPAAPTFAPPVLPTARGETAPPAVAGYVMGIATDAAAVAFPLDTIQEVGMVNAQVADTPPFVLVALGEPGAVAAWQRESNGQELTFTWDGEWLRDQETGSRWDARSGVAQEGALAGTELAPFPVRLTHWLGWVDLYPTTTVWNAATSTEGQRAP